MRSGKDKQGLQEEGLVIWFLKRGDLDFEKEYSKWL